MDWVRAIELNRKALTGVVAEIFALLGLVTGGTLESVSSELCARAQRLLRPAESALRRLIVIAARGLIVKPVAARAMPVNLKNKSKTTGRKSFQLFDQRKQYDFITQQTPTHIVVVKTYTSNPFNLFDRMYWPVREKPKSLPSAAQLCRRLAAISYALETIPQQARRLVRWQERRKAMKKAKFTTALRQGNPPGHRDCPSITVDFILKECDGLARDSLREDTS